MAIREKITQLDSILTPVQVINSDTDTFFPASGSIDTSAQGLAIICQLFYENHDTGVIVLTLQHSDDASSGFVDIDEESTAHKNGLRDTNVSDQIGANEAIVNLGPFSNKRFIRAKVTSTGATGDNDVRVLFNLFPEVIDGGVN